VDLSIVFLALAFANPAEDGKLPPINPDRPDFTDGAGIVPPGKVLFEFGYRQTASGRMTLREYGDQPMARFALRPDLELRLTGPTYAVADEKGAEDTTVGAKWVFHQGKDSSGFRSPSLGLEASVEIVTGARDFRAERAIPQLTGIVDFSIADGWDLAGNLGFVWNKDSEGDFWRTSASLSLGHDLSEKLGSFFEAYMLMENRHGVPTDHFADTGLTYRLNNDCQLDISVGAQLDRRRQTGIFGFGASFRF